MMTTLGKALYQGDCLRFAKDVLGFIPDEKQAEVLRSRSRRGILNCSRQWGKSTVIAVMAVHRAYFVRDSLVLVASPTDRQSSEFLRKVKGLARVLGIRAKGDRHNRRSMQFPNGARIVGLPCDEGTVRGFSAVSLLVIDEAALVPDVMYRALRPMLATSDGDLLMMSTPRGKRGFFYKAWTDDSARWQRTMAPASECSRISEEFLAEELDEMGEEMYRREYCCEFTEDDEALFREEWMEKARRNDVKPLWGAS